jgi:cell wall-associated NlpC family hydrolase
MKKQFIFSLVVIFFSSCISQKKLSNQRKVSKVIGEARTYIGTPYKWGGNDKRGIDCSGLLVRSFESIGMKIPRTTSQQIDIGKKVSLKKSKEGDLVFFAFGKSRRKVTHVGIL